MDTQQLITAVGSQRFGVTGSYNNGNPTADWGQCTAIPHKWEQMLGLGIVYGNACDTYTNAPDALYIKELNTPAGVPLPGAIVVWQAGWAGSSVGHTAVVLSGTDVNTLRVLEQNNPIGTAPRIATHDYTGVLGWFYPRKLQQATTTPTGVPTADNEGVVNGQGLRVHSQPNTTSSYDWFYDDNEHITILSRVQGETVTTGAYAPSAWWYQTDKGWVSDAFVRTLKTPANVPDYAVTPPPAPQYSPRPTTGLFGVDVSSFQGDIDFAALVGNIDFLVIRAGHVGTSLGGGADETDTKFIQNRDKARQLLEPRAFYWYCFPSLDPVQEAAHFTNSVGSLEPGESLWADIEEDDDNLVDWCKHFKAAVEQITGRKLRGYYNQDFHDRYPGLKDVFGADGVWAAHYGEPAEQRPFPEAIMHQYTSSGKLPGISGNLDLNVFFGTADEFLALSKPFDKPIDPKPTPTPSEPPANSTNLFKLLVDWVAQFVRAVLGSLKKKG